MLGDRGYDSQPHRDRLAARGIIAIFAVAGRPTTDGAPCFAFCVCAALVIERDCSYISIHFSLEIAEISLPIASSGKSSGDSKDLMQEGIVGRKWGLLTIRDGGFAKFLRHALPHKTAKLWKREIAVSRPFSLQTSLLILGLGIVAFLIYTQGEVFNTWVTYATGVAAAVPKAIQFFDNLRLGKATKT